MMRGLERLRMGVNGAAWLALMGPAIAHAEAATTVGEIIVTAEKQEQAANTVGMSITAARCPWARLSRAAISGNVCVIGFP